MHLTRKVTNLEPGVRDYNWKLHELAEFPIHDHEFFEFFLVASGRVRHYLNGRERLLEPGALQFLFPRDRHGFQPECPGGKFRLYNCNISARELMNCFHFLDPAHEFVLPDMVQTAVTLAPEQIAFLEKKWEKLLQPPPALSSGLLLARSRILTQEILQTFMTLSAGGRVALPAWLEHAAGLMERPDNLVRGLPRLIELAARSPEHIARTFRRYYGITPVEWIRERRLDMAAELLRETGTGIAEITFRCGFNNLAYFRRCFWKRFNRTPREYRREMSGELAMIRLYRSLSGRPLACVNQEKRPEVVSTKKRS